MRIRLLGAFCLEDGDEASEVTPASARVLAILALRGVALPRTLLAGMLWPDKCEERAAANLRAALWRLGDQASLVVDTASGTLALHHGVAVDLSEALQAARLVDSGDPVVDIPDPGPFFAELLPQWDDEWLESPRRRWRQARLRALDRLCQIHLEAGRVGDAVDLARRTFDQDPIRQTAACNYMAALAAGGEFDAAELVAAEHRRAFGARFNGHRYGGQARAITVAGTWS